MGFEKINLLLIAHIDSSIGQLALLVCIIAVLSILIAFLAVNLSQKRRHELQLLAKMNADILEQKRKLEESNEMKAQLFSIVSHDFRSPLASLRLFLDLLEGGDLDQAEIKQLSQELKERMNMTFLFMDNLLEWAQSQLNGYQPNLINVNIHNAVEDSFNLFKKQAEIKQISLFNNISKDEEIMSDSNMIKLVLRNLLSNALKYTGNLGKVVIYVNRTPDKVNISVSDTGVGISEDMQQDLYSIRRMNTAGTADEPGTGLGLMLCKEFIEKNGGSIWVESELGKGSTFSFSIPVDEYVN